MASEICFKGNIYMQTTTNLATFLSTQLKLRNLYCYSCQNGLDPEHLFRSRQGKKLSGSGHKTLVKNFVRGDCIFLNLFFTLICFLSPHHQGLVQAGGPGSCCTPPGPQSTGLSSPAPLHTPKKSYFVFHQMQSTNTIFSYMRK
jgi:hypothetical protein